MTKLFFFLIDGTGTDDTGTSRLGYLARNVALSLAFVLLFIGASRVGTQGDMEVLLVVAWQHLLGLPGTMGIQGEVTLVAPGLVRLGLTLVLYVCHFMFAIGRLKDMGRNWLWSLLLLIPLLSFGFKLFLLFAKGKPPRRSGTRMTEKSTDRHGRYSTDFDSAGH